MDFKLTEEQVMIRRMARDFAEGEIAPIAAECDAQATVPLDNLKKMGRLGFMGLIVPERCGGSGLDSLALVLAIEEVSKACASTGVMMSVHNSLVCGGILKFGTEAQKLRYLPRLATGDWIGAFALTEAGAGCDAAAIQTRAVRDGDHYVLNGSKRFVTSGGIADLVMIFAKTSVGEGHKGISAFLVERGTPGFTHGPEEAKMGIRASSTTELILEDCRLPVECLLGQAGQGFKIAMALLDASRPGVAAQALGIGSAAYEASLSYAQERQQFGKPIASFQAIQWMLVEMATRLEAARLLTYKSALAKDEAEATGDRYSKEAAMAKLFASETAVWVTNKAVQIHGGYGYMKEYPVERYFRDAKVTEIYEGTSEVQRMVIAGAILG